MLYAFPMTIIFKHYEELEDWLETITNLDQFWRETAVYNVPIPANEDGMREMIVNGEITPENALSNLKGVFRMMLGDILNLEYDIETPINISVH